MVTSLVILPPFNKNFEPVISPSDPNCKVPSADFILDVSTVNPAIEADVNLAKPSEVNEDEALRTVDVAPAMVAGKNNESTARSPLTVKALSLNCKKLELALSPSSIDEPDI